MLRMSLMAGGFALCLAAPAFAQGSMYGPPNTATPPNTTTDMIPSGDTSAMTCDQIMEQVRRLSLVGPGATMAFKQKEMIAARAARDQNNEAACKMHATRALQLVTYHS